MGFFKFFVFVSFSLIARPLYAQPLSYYVATNGKDGNPGTLSKPFGTIEKACQALVALKKKQGGSFTTPVTVYFRQGVYYIKKTIRLDNSISGNERNRVVFSAYRKEDVSINGGENIPLSLLQRVTDRNILNRLPIGSGILYQVGLKAAGINDYGVMRSHGFRRPYFPAAMEVFLNKQPLQLARYPNDSSMLIGHLVDAGSIPVSGDFTNRGGLFNYTNKRINKWYNASDAWMGGYFNWGYADDEVPLKKIDTAHQIVYSEGPTLFGFSSGLDFRKWFVYNLLEELDMPGEYYIDRQRGILYFMTGSKTPVTQLEVSLLEEPMLSLTACSYITIKDIRFENSRGIAVYMEKGAGNILDNCAFRNLGMVGVVIGRGIEPFKVFKHDGNGDPASETIGSLYEHLYANASFDREAGKNHGIINCSFKGIGMGAISLGGGNRKTLEAAGNYIINCDISNFNRLGSSYKGAVNLDGVGNIIRNCHIYNSPHTAIYLHGNNHIIEYNEINNVCKEANDMGAVYIGRDPSEAGHKIRYNYFHDIEPRKPDYNIAAVYFDDGSILNEVTGNVFYKCGSRVFGAIFVHGGFEHLLDNNIFIDCELAVGNAAWNNQAWISFLNTDLIKQRIYKEVNIRSKSYTDMYPSMGDILSEGNKNLKVSGSYLVQCSQSFAKSCITENNWITNDTSGFKNFQAKNFLLKPNSAVYKKIENFRVIPYDKIGRMGKSLLADKN